MTTRRAGLAALGAGWLAAACGTGPQKASLSFDPHDLQHAELLRERALQDTEAWRLVQSLVNQVGPRPAGSPADAQAVAWAVAAATRLGLSNVRAEPLSLKVWQRGAGQARLLTPSPQPLVMAALGNSIGTPPEGLQGELAYYPTLKALLDDSSGRARGRIVFIDQPTERSRDGRGYGAAVGARVVGAIEAARRGAIALAIRSIGTDRERIAHTGALRYDLQVPRIPAFAVSVPDAEAIGRLHAAGTVPTLFVQMDNRLDVEATSHNVVAEVPGGDLAREIVLIGAHLDSWDLGRGALDNGAGVGIVLAAASLIAAAGRRPRRTVRVVLFANEENGFDGARAYGDRHRDVPHQLVGESDFGAGRVWRLRHRLPPAARPAVEPLARLLAPLGVALPKDAADEGVPGPDAALLMRRHRWPGIELTQDGTHYFDVHHTEHDTLERIDPATLPQNVACWAVTAWWAAHAPWPFGTLPATSP